MHGYICKYIFLSPVYLILLSTGVLKWIITSSVFSASGIPFVQFLLFYNPVMRGHLLLSGPSLLILCLSAVPLYYISIYTFVRVLHFPVPFFFVLASFYFYLLFLIPLHVSLRDFQEVTLTYQKIPAGFNFLTTWETLHAEFMSLENFWLNRQAVEGLNVEKLQVMTNFNLILSDIV